jgi:uncharacterized protein (DUF2164 family)
MIKLKMPREQKVRLIQNVKTYFEETRSEPIGDLAAEQFIDFMLEQLGPYVYNQAVRDARAMVAEKYAQIEDELYALEKPLR